MYQDYKHVSPVNPVDLSIVDPQVRQNANGIRSKAFGVDVRELIARTFEWVAMLTSQHAAETVQVMNRLNQMQNEFDNMLNKLTSDSEVIDARTDADGTNFVTLKKRLDHEQIVRGHFGPTVATDDSQETIKLVGLSETSKGLHYKTVVTNDEQPVRGGLHTMQISQLKLKEVQK